MQANLLKKLLTRTRQVFPSHTINYLLPDVLPIGLHRSECEIRLFLASDMSAYVTGQTLSVCVSIGYEDGRQFEEINDVQLQEVTVEEQVQLDYIEQLHQQQQQ